MESLLYLFVRHWFFIPLRIAIKSEKANITESRIHHNFRIQGNLWFFCETNCRKSSSSSRIEWKWMYCPLEWLAVTINLQLERLSWRKWKCLFFLHQLKPHSIVLDIMISDNKTLWAQVRWMAPQLGNFFFCIWLSWFSLRKKPVTDCSSGQYLNGSCLSLFWMNS